MATQKKAGKSRVQADTDRAIPAPRGNQPVQGSNEDEEYPPQRILETLSGINSDIDSLEDVITALSDRLKPILQQCEIPVNSTSERTISEEWSPLRLGAADMRNRLSNLREQVLDLLDRTDL